MHDHHMHGYNMHGHSMATQAMAHLGAVESHGRQGGQPLAVLVLEDDVAEACAIVSRSKS